MTVMQYYCPRCQVLRDETTCPVCLLVLANKMVLDDPTKMREVMDEEGREKIRKTWFEEKHW